MYKIFLFFPKEEYKREVDFFFNKKCTATYNDLNYEIDDENWNIFFTAYQNNQFIVANDESIGYINNYCGKILEFLKQKNCSFNPEFIIAVHPPDGKDIPENLKWQEDMSRMISGHSFKVVYYSSKDTTNQFVTKNEEDPCHKYNYESLIAGDQEQFNKLLKLLEVRAKGDEIEFFNIRKKLDDLYHIFSIKALACKGMLECIEKGKSDKAKKYFLQSFGKSDFKKILIGLRAGNEVKNLRDIKKINREILVKIYPELLRLTPVLYQGLSFDKIEKDLLKQYLSWYGGLLGILENIKIKL